MCTYSITLNDSMIEKVRPTFADDKSLQHWLQEQVTLALERLVDKQLKDQQHSMVEESLTTAFNELHYCQTKKDARKLFA